MSGNIPVVGATGRSGGDPKQIQGLLATAQGYAVLGREGRRVGAFIELAGRDAERIAIRQDGVFFWRRRLLQVTTVAKVLPEQRAVVLNVDRGTLSRTIAEPAAIAGVPISAEERADLHGNWHKRIERYVSPGESEADQASADRADAEGDPSVESLGLERPVTGEAREPTPEPARSDQRSAAGHLLFVATSRGYALLQREGPPPSLGHDIEVPEQPGSFLVGKLGPSPLPNDPRICAYLEQFE